MLIDFSRNVIQVERKEFGNPGTKHPSKGLACLSLLAGDSSRRQLCDLLWVTSAEFFPAKLVE